MDLQYMEARFKLEHAMVAGLLNGEGTLPERTARVQAQQADNLPTPPDKPMPGLAIPDSAWQVALPEDVYSWIQSGLYSWGRSEKVRITDEIIKESKAFVSELLGVDLAEVRVVIVSTGEWGNEEGWGKPPPEAFQVEAGADAPLILVPETVHTPHELLVHELAHAAHTLVRRRDGDPAKAFSSEASAEFIAHFAQYRYLRHHGKEEEFAAAMGQLTTAMYAMAIWSYSQEHEIRSLEVLQACVADFLASAYARPFRDALGDQILTSQFANFSGSFSYLASEINRAVAIMMAVIFNDDPEGVRKYMAIDSLDRSVSDKVAESFGQDLEFHFPLFEGYLMRMRDEFR